MKKLNFLFVLLLIAATTAFAQVPQAINFQAIARDGNGDVMANTNIMIQLTILEGGAGGTELYREIRSLTTNGYGSFSFQIGVAPFMSEGNFGDVAWETGDKFMKVDYDPTATLSFNLTLGTIEFASVPYAFAAGAVSYIDLTGVQDGDVLIYNSVTGKFEPGQVPASSLDWANILNKPDFAGWDTDASNDFSGSWNDLLDVPTLFNGDYNALTNKPAFATVATTGNYADLLNTPTLNTANWDAAYAWGNHAGLYRASTWVPAWTDVTGKPTFATVATSGSFADLTGKPTTLAGYGITNAMSTAHAANGITAANITNWTTAYGWGNHAGLYRASTWVPAWTDVTGKPTFATVATSGSYTDLTNKPTTDGSETKLSAGTNVTLSGNGTAATPYVINVAGASLLAPTVTASAASVIQSFAATMNGTVNANNLSTTVVFEWGTTTAYGSTATATPTPVTGTSATAVSAALTGLQSNTTYHYRIKATNAVNVTYSSDITFTTSISAPQLTTTAISAILAFTATSGGNVTYDGGAAVTARGICYSTSSTPTTANTTIPTGTGTGTFVSNMTGLTKATTYYVRAYATNSAGTTYGNELSFTTQNGVATLSTTAASAITGVAATSGGNITADGGSTITARGICYNTSTNPTTANATVANGSGTGSFAANMSGLIIGTTYYIRAYATNGAGTSYGNEVSFTTVALPSVTTTAANDIRGNSANAGGSVTNNGGSTVTAQGLCWSTSANPTTANSTTTSFTADMTSLSPNTVYYVRAYATNVAGTGYGNQISFNSGRLIGSSYAGGLVFYNDGSAHGLVSADSDQSTGAEWGCYGTAIYGTSTAINTGAANTNAIVAGCGTAGIAASLCYDLSLNGYTDWYLPSREELNLMYVNLKTQSLGNFTSSWYWSSSENAGNETSNAWEQNFSDGYQNYYGKSIAFYVRAVRAF